MRPGDDEGAKVTVRIGSDAFWPAKGSRFGDDRRATANGVVVVGTTEKVSDVFAEATKETAIAKQQRV